MNYTPKPIDTSDIKLPKEMIDLCEMLAENTHEVWAERRAAQGWVYGEIRSDEKRETPCMVPYSDLSEEEKGYDRNTAMETIKLIVKLGYKIIKK